jgi:hypothetical protein
LDHRWLIFRAACRRLDAGLLPIAIQLTVIVEKKAL